MRAKKVLIWARSKLQHLNTPSLEAEYLLSKITQQSRVQLKTNDDQSVSFINLVRYMLAIYKRSKHQPVAYILGYKEWAGLKLKVNKYTLIPRDETAILMSHIENHIRKTRFFENNSKPLNLLDVGTGSGAIALWFRSKFPEMSVTAIDISHKALKIAQKNAQNYRQPITFYHSDLLSFFRGASQHFDIVVANLPYVPRSIRVTPEVNQEPASAIFADDEGLELIKRLKQQLESNTISWNELWLEFLPQQQKALQELFNSDQIEWFDNGAGEIFFARITRSA